MGGRSRSVGATLIAGFVALGLACAGDDASDPQASDTPDAGSDEPETLSPEAEVEAAYLAHWEMLDRLGQSPDPDDPEIPRYTSGEALLDVVYGLSQLKERGHASEIGPLYAHTVEPIEVVGEQAVLRDCVIDDSQIVDQRTGEVVEAGQVAVALLEVALEVEDGLWKVNRVERIPVEPSTTSCEELDR